MSSDQRFRPAVYTVPEVAKLFGVHRRTVYEQVRTEGAFAGVTAIRISDRQYKFSKTAIDRRIGQVDPADSVYNV